jgi:hypothetical protein
VPETGGRAAAGETAEDAAASRCAAASRARVEALRLRLAAEQRPARVGWRTQPRASLSLSADTDLNMLNNSYDYMYL